MPGRGTKASGNQKTRPANHVSLSRSPSSPSNSSSERRSKGLLTSRLLHGDREKHLRPAFSLEAPPCYVPPKPRVFLDIKIEGIVVSPQSFWRPAAHGVADKRLRK